MHVGVDATCWHNTRGYGRHARALLNALVRAGSENHYTLIMDSAERPEDVAPGAGIRRVDSSAPAAVAASAKGRRSVLDLWKMSRALSAPQFDLLLFPTIYSYVPVVSRAKKIVMIHDIIPEKYPGLTLPRPASRFLWKIKTALGRWQADAIVTVSDYSRQCILERFSLAPERVFVVGEASDSIFRVLDVVQPGARLRSLGLPSGGRLAVYVGGFGPHKNLETLLAVFARLAVKGEFADLRLIMVGEFEKEVFHSDYGSLINAVEELGISSRVVFTGYLADEDLVVLLNLSTVLLLPSLIEGFGLPAVEAAACGCPVIATTESPLPTLLGEGALYVNPTKPEELELALARVMVSEEQREKMRAAGVAAARRLTWHAAARQMLDVFNQVAAQ